MTFLHSPLFNVFTDQDRIQSLLVNGASFGQNCQISLKPVFLDSLDSGKQKIYIQYFCIFVTFIYIKLNVTRFWRAVHWAKRINKRDWKTWIILILVRKYMNTIIKWMYLNHMFNTYSYAKELGSWKIPLSRYNGLKFEKF